MTDIVNVLRMNDEGEEWTNIRTFFLRQAADEIDRLRLTVMNLCVANGKLEDERDDLHEEVRRLRVEAGYD